ncbi:stress-induced-phosphoprotein 1-like [Sycon ciliatum]|uniref:stress-induced-phosphoprotein 1-like n=1 Tax=Sycon ciliatum TaxID=27933 RepID=UPI0031F684D0
MGDDFKAKGNAAMQAGNAEQAVDFYTQGIAIDGNNHVLYSNRSAAYAKLNRFSDALEDAQKTTSIKPDWAKGYSRVGTALSFLDRHSEAIDAFETGLGLDANNATLKSGLADAKERSEAAMAQSPSNPFSGPDVMAKLAADPRTADLIKQPDFMVMLNQIQRNPGNISQYLSDPRLQATLGVLLNADFLNPDGPGDDSGSAPQTSSSPTMNKPTASPPRAEAKAEAELSEADAAKQLGNEAYKKKDFEAALQHYDKAIELDGTNMTYLTNKAAVYFEQSRFDECVETCLKSIDVGREQHADFKNIAKALGRIGSVHLKKEEYEDAIKWFNKSLAEHRMPDILKKLQQAEKILEERRYQAYLSPEIALEEKTKGNQAFQKGDYPSAISHYTESIKRNPDDPKVYSNRAACYTKLAEFRMGLNDCETVIKLDPKFVKGYTRKGLIHLALKEQSKAAAAFQEALSLDPNNADAQDGMRKSYQHHPTTMTDAEREQVAQRAMADPEVQQIMQDPAMRTILQQMQEDPKAIREHLKNPVIGEKLQKLVDSGLVSMR